MLIAKSSPTALPYAMFFRCAIDVRQRSANSLRSATVMPIKYVLKSMNDKITDQLSAVNTKDNHAGNIQRGAGMVQFAMDVKTARLLNLRTIIANDFGGNAGKCADKLEIKRPQIHRWVTTNDAARQGISEDSARSIEAKLGKPHGLMDALPGDTIEAEVDAQAVAEFSWVYQHVNADGRDFLRKAIAACRGAYIEQAITEQSKTPIKKA